jgi:hypothetical protein
MSCKHFPKALSNPAAAKDLQLNSGIGSPPLRKLRVGISSAKRLFQVFNQIIRMFQANGQAQQVRGAAGAGAFH